MAEIDVEGARDLLEAVVTASSLLGGTMAYLSGFRASRALAGGAEATALSQVINEGIAEGFEVGFPLAALALIIEVWA